MSKISSTLRIVGLVLLVAGTAAARTSGWSSAYHPAAYGTARFTTQRTDPSPSSDAVTWTTLRLRDRSYWYASDGTTCASHKRGQVMVIRCY